MDLSGVTWRKSSYSGNTGGNCVEVGLCCESGVAPLHLIRDSKHPDGPKLAFAHGGWEAFIAGVKHGDFGPATSA